MLIIILNYKRQEEANYTNYKNFIPIFNDKQLFRVGTVDTFL